MTVNLLFHIFLERSSLSIYFVLVSNPQIALGATPTKAFQLLQLNFPTLHISISFAKTLRNPYSCPAPNLVCFRSLIQTYRVLSSHVDLPASSKYAAHRWLVRHPKKFFSEYIKKLRKWTHEWTHIHEHMDRTSALKRKGTMLKNYGIISSVFSLNNFMITLQLVYWFTLVNGTMLWLLTELKMVNGVVKSLSRDYKWGIRGRKRITLCCDDIR